jgi:eukaryotic-like serine/threonine-protein kinase
LVENGALAMAAGSNQKLALALSVLNEGHTLGRYELLAPIGRGGMAIVWAARLRGTRGFSKLVAIKTMLPTISSDPRFERMFLSEAEIASRIRHPNVCEILDLGEDEGTLYLVMEWIEGESLAAIASSQPRIPYGVAATIGAQAARGLAAAHDLQGDDGRPYGVVHRDVSPHNVLVRKDGLVKIVDFGVARAAERTDHVTESGFIKGKVGYLAPEQAEGRELDGRADVFALGVLLYELTTGTHPFRGATDVATLLRISSGENAAAPETLVSDYPADLSSIVLRALAKDREERPATMTELARELEAVAARLDVDPQAALRAFAEETTKEACEERRGALREAAALADARAVRAIAPPPADAPRRALPRWLIPSSIGALALALGVGIGMRQRSTEQAAPATPTAPSAPIRELVESAAPPPASASAEAVPPLPAPADTVPKVRPSMPRRAATEAATTSVASAPPAPPVPAPTSSGETRFREPGF